MDFDEHAVYVRTEVLKAIDMNEKNIELMEKICAQRGSREFLMMDQYLGKCLKEKLTPELLDLYKESKSRIPGLSLDVKNKANVGSGEFHQYFEFRLYQEVIGRCVIYSRVIQEVNDVKIESKLEALAVR